MARETPKVYVEQDDHQVNRRSIVLEVEGKIVQKYLYILIDLGFIHSYVNPKVVEIFSLEKNKCYKSWLVQLDICTKMKMSGVVMECPMELNGILTKIDLNILPLGSYDSLISMDQLGNHRTKLDCYDKVLV